LHAALGRISHEHRHRNSKENVLAIDEAMDRKELVYQSGRVEIVMLNSKEELRKKAENILKDHGTDQVLSKEVEAADALALVHELQVHQIEREMQNEELKRAKLESEEALMKYSDLYDFAPLALFTLDKDGFIRDVNLAGVELLGIYRSNLLNNRFELFVTLKDRPTLDAFCHEIYFTGIKQKCELCLLKSTGEQIRVYIEGTATEKPAVEYRLAVIDITDRKKAEEALKESEEKFRVIADTSQASITLYQDGHVVYSNKASEAIFGYSIDERRSMMLAELVHPDYQEIAKEHMKAVLEGKSYSLQNEYKIIRKDGEERWVLSSGSQLTYRGKPAILVNSVDITEQKQTERKISQQNVILNAINHVYEEAIRCDTIEDLGRACLDIVESTTSSKVSCIEEIGPDSLLQDIAISDTGWELCKMYDKMGHRKPLGGFKIHGLYGRVIQDGSSLLTNDPSSHPDSIGVPEGHLSLTSFLGVPFILDGKAIGLIGVANREGGYRREDQEILEALAPTILEAIMHKRANEELQENQTVLKTVIESMPDYITLKDREGRYVMMNSVAAETLKQSTGLSSAAEIIGKRDDDILSSEVACTVMKSDRRVIASGKMQALDQSFTIRNDFRAFSTIKSPYRDITGSVVGVVNISRDITERKKMEEDLHKAKDELQQRIAERTTELRHANEKLEKINAKLIDEIKWHANAEAELKTAKENQESINEKLHAEIEQHKKTEDELMKAKEASEAAVKAKSAFLANMSHEIRTPMNAVIGFTELLLEEQLIPEQKESLELIRINGDALLAIINDILDFSKIESDKLILEEQPFILRQLVEEALGLVVLKASEKGLNLAYIIDKAVPDTIIADPGRLRQVLGNLLSNAVKFTDMGTVTLSVSSREIDTGWEIHFDVQDTGIGISKDRMNLLFQPFNQIEPSTHRLYGGTGLGLAISKNLVELMDGKIWADSEVGKGSTFHFIITTYSQFEPQPAVVSPSFMGKHVLIVSENKTNRRILGKQTYDWGMIPMIAASGKNALKYIKQGDNFDVAFLDMDMQDISSLDLEEEIRKYNRTLPLVLLTSLGSYIPPNYAYLNKPIKTSQLHNVLSNILSSQPAKSVVPASTVSSPPKSSPLRILLAEDNVSSQKIILQMLRKLGHRADVAANGLEVLQALQRQHYDVVLMDVKMPEMDGFETAQTIRQRWPDNGPKIIAITAYAVDGDRARCLSTGMNDYIAKPVRIVDLKNALKDIDRL